MRTQVAVLSAILFSAPVVLAAAEDREVPAFDSVHVASGIRATIAVGARRPVHLEADKDVLEAIETRVEDGTLHVGFKPHSRVSSTGEVIVSIQTPDVHAVAASGGAMVRATFTRWPNCAIAASGGGEVHVREVDARQLAVEGSGGAVLDVAGRADQLDLQLSGGSHFDAREFEARNVDLHGSGGSVADLRATGKVRGGLSGGSEVHVRGGARAHVSTSGGSEISVAD
ncbi:MAG: GIN domain-containing protein [Myxococcales bacterium]